MVNNMIHGIYLLEIKHYGKETHELVKDTNERMKELEVNVNKLRPSDNEPGKYLLMSSSGQNKYFVI